MASNKLSIITITYKDPEGFAGTIESLRTLLDASFGRPWEFVVVDASPTENAPSIAKMNEENWPLVHVEAKPVGIYGSQNLGLAHATGDYIWILNGGTTSTVIPTSTWSAPAWTELEKAFIFTARHSSRV